MDYRKWIDEVRASFPGCWLCEANLLAWLLYSDEFSAFEANNWFQVSTNVFNDGTDHWDEFELEQLSSTPADPAKTEHIPLLNRTPGTSFSSGSG